MKIGILGSVCDPPHRNHIAIGEGAKQQLGLDLIILIPTKVPPHKDRPKVSENMRLQMARLAIQGKKRWIVSDLELRRKGKSYTRDTIAVLKKKFTRDTLFWIFGADSLVSMPWKWKGGYDLLDLCQFVVAPRFGFSLKRVPRSIFKKVIVLKLKSSSTASSKIRKSLKDKKDVRRFLDTGVLSYIKKHHLYT